MRCDVYAQRGICYGPVSNKVAVLCSIKTTELVLTHWTPHDSL